MASTSLTQFYKFIKPYGHGGTGIEEFALFQQRVAPLLPHFPAEVLEDWLYRHHDDAVRTYGGIDFRRLRFEKQMWPTERFVLQVRSNAERLVDAWARAFIEGGRMGRPYRQSWLGTSMLAQRTWPIVPIVLDDTSKVVAPAGVVLNPCHLVEGHHRLAYLRALVQMPGYQPQPHHEVWVMRIESVNGAAQ